MKPALEVRLLGPFSLRLNGEPIDTSGWQRRPAMLLRLLAASAGNHRTRDDVIDLLWPASDPSAGATNLRYVLHLLRRYLAPSPPAIISQGGWVSLSPEYEWSIDLTHLARLAVLPGDKLEALRQAASLLTGEPLVDDRYEDWAAPIRDDVARSWRSIARDAAQEARDRGDLRGEADAYELLLRQDPLDEDAMGGLLQVLGRLGQRSEALQRYSTFEQRYVQELDAPPGEELAARVRELHERIAGRGSASAPDPVLEVRPRYPLPTGTLMVGRDDERQAITGVFPSAEDSADGLLRLVAIQGEAGMGKTWLLGGIARVARERGLLVLAGGCYELEGRLPYGPVHDALVDYALAAPEGLLVDQLAGIAADIVSVLPEVRGRVPAATEAPIIDPDARRLRLFAAISSFLSRISSLRPTVLILDDLHWSDDESISLLHYLSRQPDLGRLLILTALRAEEAAHQPAITALIRQKAEGRASALVLSLAPLPRQELAQLLSQRLNGACGDDLIDIVAERSAANPFFALQIVRLLQKEDRLHFTDDVWTTDAQASVDLPEEVRDLISRRLRHMSPGERAVLAEASVLGRELTIAPLSAVTRSTEPEMWDALDRAVESFVLAETDAGYAFRHPLLHEVIYAAIPQHRRTALHARVGLELERLYGQDMVRHVSELAHHFAQAGEAQAQRRRIYAVLAGDEATRSFAHSAAEQHFRQALSSPDSSNLDERKLDPLPQALRSVAIDDSTIQIKLGRALTYAGKNAEALVVLHAALDRLRRRGDIEGSADLAALMGEIYLRLGTKEEGIALVESIIATWGDRQISSSLVRLHLTKSVLVYWATPGGGQGLNAALETLRLAEELGDPVLRAEAQVGHARELLRARRWTDAYQVLEQAVSVLEAAEAYNALREALTMLFQLDWLSGKYDTTSRWIEKGVEVARRIGEPYMLADFLAALARHHVYTGQWDLTIRYGEEGVSAVHRTDGAQFRGFVLGMAPTIRALRGDRDARAQMEAACAACEEVQEMTSVSYVQSWLAKLEMLDGATEAAIARLEGVRARTHGAEPGMATATLATAYLQAGQLEACAQCIEKADAAARGRPLEEIEVLRARALLAARLAGVDEARDLILSALERARAMPFPFAEARFLYDLATIQAGAGELAAARSSLAMAEEIFAKLGAKPFLMQSRRLRREIQHRSASGPGSRVVG